MKPTPWRPARLAGHWVLLMPWPWHHLLRRRFGSLFVPLLSASPPLRFQMEVAT